MYRLLNQTKLKLRGTDPGLTQRLLRRNWDARRGYRGKYMTPKHCMHASNAAHRLSQLPVVKPTSPWSIRPNPATPRAISTLPRRTTTMYALLLPSKGLRRSCASTTRALVGKCGCRRRRQRRRRRRFPLGITRSQYVLRGRCRQPGSKHRSRSRSVGSGMEVGYSRVCDQFGLGSWGPSTINQ